jgi:6-phosphogluconolactonase/glucosamine-6-phosphate isomerase/deaminase
MSRPRGRVEPFPPRPPSIGLFHPAGAQWGVSSEAEPFDLVPGTDVPTPRLTGGVVHRPDADTLIDALLADLAIHARNCIRAFGDFQFALSATAQIEPCLRRLMYDLNHRDFPWNHTRVWMVDEITAPEEDSRWATVSGLVLEQSGIPPEQIHRLSITAPPSEGVAAYESTLRETLGWREKGHDRLDYVLLSLSPSGGVAGFDRLQHPPIQDDSRLVQEVEGSEDAPAVSMTLQFINAARMVAVMASGAECRDAVARIAQAVRTRRRDHTMPVLYLDPMAGELRFYVDNAACPGR